MYHITKKKNYKNCVKETFSLFYITNNIETLLHALGVLRCWKYYFPSWLPTFNFESAKPNLAIQPGNISSCQSKNKGCCWWVRWQYTQNYFDNSKFSDTIFFHTIEIIQYNSNLLWWSLCCYLRLFLGLNLLKAMNVTAADKEYLPKIKQVLEIDCI